MEDVTVAILAKDKAHCLKLYLRCILQQTYPKKHINLYVRTNNNNDDTEEVLRSWLEEHQTLYNKVYFNAEDVQENVQCFTPHEWNGTRFSVLGRLRQESVDWARENDSHYFVADCDNFILPHTIDFLLRCDKDVVAPLLKGKGVYANFHHNVTEDGYCADCGRDNYMKVFSCVEKGTIQVPVVHCTYLIRKRVLDKVCYLDGSGRHEYVIFSEQMRKNNIPQYINNESYFGYLTFADTEKELREDVRFKQLYSMLFD